MELKDKVTVITGAASGIGRALAVKFQAEGAKTIICADMDMAGAEETAAMTGGIAWALDVSKEEGIKALIEQVEDTHGGIDLFVSNAGIGFAGGAEVENEAWQLIWDVNVMAHVWAARHIVPRMLGRGGGYLLNTASAAGLLSQIGSAPYAVTKHAAVSFAEWLAITYGKQGLKVSVLCPQAVRTNMTADNPDGVASVDGMMEPEDVAAECVNVIRAETFLVLPHKEVGEYIKRKAGDYDRWLGGMQKLNELYSADADTQRNSGKQFGKQD